MLKLMDRRVTAVPHTCHPETGVACRRISSIPTLVTLRFVGRLRLPQNDRSAPHLQHGPELAPPGSAAILAASVKVQKRQQRGVHHPTCHRGPRPSLPPGLTFGLLALLAQGGTC